MRAVIFACVFACSVVLGQDNSNDVKNLPKYDDRYDYLELDAILDSKRLVRNYVDCLVNVKPCTPEGKTLKKMLPEALRTKCVRCTERQKRTAVKVIKRLKTEYPMEWSKLSSRWDPTGDFTRFFEDFLAKEAFNSVSGHEISSPAPTIPPTSITLTPETIKPPVPVLLNRFGDDEENIVGSPSASPTLRPTMRPPLKPLTWTTMLQPRPTQAVTFGASFDAISTGFPIRPANDFSPSYTTAITLIDQIGYKIIRTTELVTDILKNTVKAVVGR